MTTQELIEQTKQLIAIPSTADRPESLRQAVDFVASIITAQHPDITIEWFEQNQKPSFLAYRGKKRPQKFDILLNAHVDVVPGDPKLFKPYEKNGKLYGRGALDMKGTAVALANAFCEMVNEVPYSLALQIVSDEEVGGYDCLKVQLDDGVRANFVLVGEYSNEKHTIYNAARGLCWAEIAFKGNSAHGAHLWHGTNAVVKAGDFAGAVLRRYPTPDQETWTTTASVASLSTPNDTFNKVPDSAILKIDFRFTQEDPVFENKETVKAFVRSIDPDAEVVSLSVFEPAVHVTPLNPYVQGLSAALAKVSGVQPTFLGRPGGSDGRHYSMVKNDIVEFGLVGKNSHADTEYVDIDSFEEYRQTLHAFLRQPIPKKLKSQPEEPLHEQLLRKLVAMPTFSNDFSAINNALDFIGDYLESRGMYLTSFERNGYRSIIATTKPHNKKPKVLLNAHIDMVPCPEDMLTLKLDGDRFTGRGVMDMKHAIASYLALVDALKDRLRDYDFGIMITSDEEIGSANGANPIVHELGYRPGVVVIPDGGTNWNIETFAKGVKWIKLEASGKAAHASRPWEGESAIRRLLGAIRDIEKLVVENPKPEDTFLSVGTINGGVVANQIPAEASALLDIRTGNVEDHHRLLGELQAICDDHGVTTTVHANEPPCVTDTEHPMVKPIIHIVAQVTGKTHSTSYDFGVTDGRFFSAVDVPTIVINPDCGGIHTDDEWLSRKSFTQFATVLEMYVRRMAVRKTPVGKTEENDLVWYATYGSGLSREHFLRSITGAGAAKTLRPYRGCSDKTPPRQDIFMPLPYTLYFAGNCDHCEGGGHAFITPKSDTTAHTISHAYLITKQQFAEIAAQENLQEAVAAMPYAKAKKHGHATIGEGRGEYSELVYCGTKDGHPIFSLTTPNPDLPHNSPSKAYTQILRKGLSEHVQVNRGAVIEYLSSAIHSNNTPNIASTKK